MATWNDNPDLIERLVSVQNEPCNESRDIMTMAGFMQTREDLEAYVLRHESAAREQTA